MEHAVAKFALSTLSPVISMLGSTVYESYFGGDVTAEDMKKLKIQVLPKIQTVIQEAEYPLPLDHLRPWLVDLQAAVFEAEDLLDLYEYKKIKNQVRSLPKLLKKSLAMTKESLGPILPKSSLKICLEKLQKSAEEAEELLRLIRSTPRTTTRQLESTRANTSTTSTVSTLPSPFFGREKECDILIQFLLDESPSDSNRRTKKIPITAIKGIGGSGKTTTAQGIYNDQRVATHFDLRMWVHVSRSFDVYRLTKEIFESATKKECPQLSNLDALQVNLKELISKHRRFLLVLDDIWCEDKMQWDQLLSLLNEVGERGSRIIITTRMEKVTSNLRVENVISLEELKTKDCWSILKHYAFDNSEEIIKDPDLVNIGDQIINKVKYSPLALRVVGSLLGKRVSVNEWEKILQKDMLEKTMDVLLLSFLYLPSRLQRCFAFCSLFPKGHKFYLGEHYADYDSQIVHLWIAQGFVEHTSESELTLEEKGNEYFEELISYSFFSGYGEYYMIHDLLHDLAEKVSKEHCHRIEDFGSLDIPATCIHLSIFGTTELKNIDTHNVSKMEKLRTLIIDVGSTICFRNKDIFKHLTKLRALHDISDWAMGVTVLNCTHIDRLKHLRSLWLRFDDKLLKSFAKLYHLQYFTLITDQVVINTSRYLKANTLPQGFGNLINLETLIVHGRHKSGSGTRLYRMVNWCYNSGISIEKLTSLQNLTDFGPDGVNGTMSLKRLSLLHGSLIIHNLENVKSKAEAAEAMLNQKRNLRKLEFEWSITTNIKDEYSNTCEVVLEGLEPHPNLEELTVRGYGGVKAPNWMIKENWHSRLRSLYLRDCRTLKVVPYLPPCLDRLSVESCDELMQLPPVGNTLKELYLYYCPKLMPPSMSNRPLCLNEICIRSCMGDGNQLFSDLPFLNNLQKLELAGFPNLQTLPNLSSTMKKLWIQSFPKLTSMGNLQCIASLTEIEIIDCPVLTSMGNLQCTTSLTEIKITNCPVLTSMGNLPYCTSLKSINIYGCPMLMRDKSLLEEGDIAQRLPCLKRIYTDDPLFVLAEHAFCSVESLTFYGSQRPFPQMPKDLFYQLSSLKSLDLHGYTILPNLEKLYSLKSLWIQNCPDVELLPGLPISLHDLHIYNCPSLKENYKESGPLRNTIRSISHIDIWG